MHLSSLVVWAVVHSKAVVMLLLIYCLMYFMLFVWVPCFTLFMLCILCIRSSFAIILKRQRKLVVLLLLSYRCIITINVQWPFFTMPRCRGLVCSVWLCYLLIMRTFWKNGHRNNSIIKFSQQCTGCGVDLVWLKSKPASLPTELHKAWWLGPELSVM